MFLPSIYSDSLSLSSCSFWFELAIFVLEATMVPAKFLTHHILFYNRRFVFFFKKQCTGKCNNYLRFPISLSSYFSLSKALIIICLSFFFASSMFRSFYRSITDYRFSLSNSWSYFFVSLSATVCLFFFLDFF